VDPPRRLGAAKKKKRKKTGRRKKLKEKRTGKGRAGFARRRLGDLGSGLSEERPVEA